MRLTYKEFKQAYKKFFLEAPDFIASEMVSCSDDIPTGDVSYKNAVVRAYVFLSNCKSKDISHLKILTSYEKLMRRNREAGMSTNPVDFAMILYVFHQYCVRILRSPWRTDFFTIKAYNGFYEYTLRRVLAPSVIDEMMAYIGFKRDPVDNVFIFTMQSLDHSCIRAITDAGIGCFLSYTHCMAKNDIHFKKTVPELTHLLQTSVRNEAAPSLQTSLRRSRSPDQPSCSGLGEQQQRPRNEPHSMTARERRRDNRNLYASDRPSQKMASMGGRTSKQDIYGPTETPLDLSTGVPYGHRAKKISEDRQSNSSYGSGSVDLYGGGDLRSEIVETLPSENTRNVEHTRTSSPSKRGPSTLDLQMENFSFSDNPATSSGYASMFEYDRAGKPLVDPSKKHYHQPGYSEKDKNYVTFSPASSTTRGSPDGQIAAEQIADHLSSRTSSRDHKRSGTAREHVYEEIK